jgi:hypothetical protein
MPYAASPASVSAVARTREPGAACSTASTEACAWVNAPAAIWARARSSIAASVPSVEAPLSSAGAAVARPTARARPSAEHPR